MSSSIGMHTLQDFCAEATSALRAKGYDVTVQPSDAGHGFQRFDRSGTLSGYYKLDLWGGAGAVLYYGDFRTGEDGILQSRGTAALTEAEAAEIRAAAAKERAEMQELAALECQEFWAQLTPGDHPYLKAKGLENCYGARVEYHAGTTVPMNLVVPLVNQQNVIRNLQRIGTDGQKRFWPGAELRGLAALILDEDNFMLGQGPVLLCEGFATGATLREATGLIVLCAMNAGNLREVAHSWVDRQGIIVCADNDWRNKDGNVGEKAGLEAAAACGGKLLVPRREWLGQSGSDFNDMAAVMGIAAVRDFVLGEIQQLETTHGNDQSVGGQAGARESGGAVGGVSEHRKTQRGADESENRLSSQSGENGIRSAITPKSGRGGPQKPSEAFIAKQVAGQLQPCLSVLGDLYRFVGTHWEAIEDDELADIKRNILFLSGGLFKTRDIQSCLQAVHLHCTNVGHEFFNPKPGLANFLDGTLEVLKTAAGYSLNFRKHQPEDHLTHVIPLEYEKARAMGPGANGELSAMLARVFGECADKEDRIRAVRQMYGACLMPLFPRLFLLHGPGGSGKSSLIILASRLVSQVNCAQVDPQDFNGFYLEAMIGKLINVVTDIKTTFAIEDGVVKKIEDRVLFMVNRKFKKAIYAPLPAVHIFGANKIPRTMDGESGAHVRRWSFIELPHKMVGGGDYQRDFVDKVWNCSPEGVLAFALEGLDDLIESRGKFFNPASGVERLAEWQLDSDWIGQFLADISSGEVSKIKASAGQEISRHDIWDAFKIWFQDAHPNLRPMGKIFFFRGLRQKGIPEKKINGVRYFEGYQTNSGGQHLF